MHERSMTGFVSDHCMQYLRRTLQALPLPHHHFTSLEHSDKTDALKALLPLVLSVEHTSSEVATHAWQESKICCAFGHTSS